MEQYPYHLWIVNPGETTVDADGNYDSVTETYVYVNRCRDTRSGAGRRIMVGGQEYITENIVYAPLGTGVSAGMEVIVTEDLAMSKVRCRFIVRMCHINQLHIKITG